MASDEVLFKIAADLSGLKPEFQDFSDLIKKHDQDVAKSKKAMQDYADSTVKAYDQAGKLIKNNVKQVVAEGKAVDDLDKKFQKLKKNNEEAFSPEQLKQFDTLIQKLSKDMANLDNMNLSLEDIDELEKKVSGAADEFETLNILVDFFDKKMKEASVGVASSFDVIKQKIEETQLNIAETERFIKGVGKDIDATAPGKVQAGLIQEREAAKQALIEEKVALEDYKQQLKAVNAENVTLATQLRRVKDEMVQLELEGKRGSDRWNDLSKEATEYNTVLKNTNAELNRASSSTAGLDNLIGAVAGVVGVFSAAEGAQALFGDESEDLAKTLVKLNGAIALLNGLQAIQTELTKKDTLANKALSLVKKQYVTATDASAKATLRFSAALKLLGIGLVIGGIAAMVVYWKDIAKFVGITSDKTERLNAINKEANNLYGEQIAKMKLLVQQVKAGDLSFQQKEEAVKDYNETFGETLGTVKDYTELESKLIEQGPAYIKYLETKAKAEAAYQLAIDRTKEALEKRSSKEVGFADYLKLFTPIIGSGMSPEVSAAVRRAKEAQQIEEEADAYLAIFGNLAKESEALAKALNIDIKNVTDDQKKAIKTYTSLLEELVKKQKALKTDLIENDRDREKTSLINQLEDEKKAYQEQIKNLKISETAKQKLRDEFNKLYNDKTGLAYEELRKNLNDIDRKYDAELEKVQYKALNAIDSILTNGEAQERQAIEEKWDNIRDEIEKQIKATNDQFQKEGLENILLEVDDAENKELQTFDLDSNLNRVDREKEISEAVLSIYQTNAKDIIKSEELKQLQLLNLEKQYLDNVIKAYEDSFKDISDKNLFNELIETLNTSIDPSAIEDAAQRLREAFGDETANEILKTVNALKEVGDEIGTLTKKADFQDVVNEVNEWMSSLEGFSIKLAETLGLQGEEAKQFAEGVSMAINTVLESINTVFQAEIDEHRNKIDSINETIDSVEEELDRERQLYEEGYANNYDARRKELADLKKQKALEEQELKKAQKKKAALAKAEMLINTASQLSNLITSATNIMKATSGIPFVGVAIAIGFIAAMFGAIASAKAKAKAIGGGENFRTGLKKGPLSLDGPRHEQGGFGLYNSKSGERVAEFESDEDVYVVNRQQKNKYRHVLDALIADAKGNANLDSTLEKYYGGKVAKVGRKSLDVVKHVNLINVTAKQSKQKASETDILIAKEIKGFKETFIKEFEGYKKERENKIESWETPEFFYVKKGDTIKKYPKKETV